MPLVQPTVLDLRRYTLRHVGPKAVVFPVALAGSTTILARNDMVARPLPSSNVPYSPDFASGSWTGRLYDAGQSQLVFPNKEASDGVPWRSRFDSTSKLQWIEFWIDGYLEHVMCITKVTPDRNQVLVEGYDGFQLTKTAYERDWIVVQAPRDVVERGTQLWMPTTADNFPSSSTIVSTTLTTPFGTWTVGLTGTGTATVGANGGIVLATTASGSGTAEITSSTVTVGATGTWRAIVNIQAFTLPTSSSLEVDVTESSGDTYSVIITPGTPYNVQFSSVSTPLYLNLSQPVTSFSVMIESDGEWVTAYINGAQIGGARRPHATTTTLKVDAFASSSTTSIASMTVSSAFVKALQPFLMRGSDKGDYVLPGTATTYPVGGLHARYYNNADLGSDSNRAVKIHHHSRGLAFNNGSGPGEYANQQDATINGQANASGAASSFWSVIWFGSIYLKLSAGDYTFTITLPATVNNFGLRAFIGQTQYSTELLSGAGWPSSGTFSNTSSHVYTLTVTAATLAGTLSYGNGVVQRDGWYPIKIEYAVDGTSGVAPVFRLTNSPTGYTDPGGTAIASGAQSTIVPSTSLSPLGCVDQRHQGVSHYDLVNKTAIAFGYQVSVEPQQLESGLFPGVIGPRIREGADYDVVLEPDDTQRKEGMLNYSALTDGTDQASSIWGNGAGFQNGTTGQLQAVVFDPQTLINGPGASGVGPALFDMQGWQDSADASYAPLLQVLLNSQLSLRLSPWQVISGEPIARQRLAFTWPLTNTVQQFRWRPGDGVKILARDINVQDVVPRQMLEVTRNIHPNGVTSTQVAFAGRPKTPTYVLRQALSSALRPQRTYQRQLVTLSGNDVQLVALNAGATSAASVIALRQSDFVVAAYVRITSNSASQSLVILVNGASTGSTLTGSPWSVAPVTINLLPALKIDPTNFNTAVELKNNGGSTTNIEFQLFIDVLR